VICLAEGDPAAALAAVADVLDGTAPVLGYVTVVEAHLLAGLAHRELGDQCAASQAAERALALAEPDRLVLPFAMTGSAGLLEALPRHETAHAALLADILDILHGARPAAARQSSSPPVEELSPSELRVLRYLPTNLSGARSPPSCLSRWPRSARTSAAADAAGPRSAPGGGAAAADHDAIDVGGAQAEPGIERVDGDRGELGRRR
jgi:hypothetical protein